MNSTELYAMITRMNTYGGSFVSSIAQALRFADPTNRQKLLDAFPNLIQEYGPKSRFARAEQLTQV
jgi:hypothetical protein